MVPGSSPGGPINFIMYYFKEYSDYFLKSFKNKVPISAHDIPLLFGKGLVNKISSQLVNLADVNRTTIKESTSSLVSILSDSEATNYKQLTDQISKSLLNIDEASEVTDLKGKLPHLSWLSLDYNREKNAKIYSLLFKQMRSYNFLKFAESLASEIINFNQLKLIERMNNKYLLLALPHTSAQKVLIEIRSQMLKELHLEQPASHLELPPHISLLRLKTLSNEQISLIENLNFEFSINATNLIILRHLNRVKDQPVFSVAATPDALI